jgi:hypothetical protein
MSGHLSQEQLALYAGEDLALQERDAEHLNACLLCQTALAELRSTREILLTASLPEPTELDLLSVRRGLTRRVQQLESRRPRKWMQAAAILAATLVVAVAVSRRDKPPVVKPVAPQIQTARVAATPSTPPPPPVSRVVRVRRVHPRPGIRAVSLLARRDGPPQLQLTTNDPNVVILLEMKEETENP